MLTQERLKEFVEYFPESGLLRYKKIGANLAPKIGAPVGRKQKSGYINTKFLGKVYGVHRLIWLYIYGQFPDGHIDHINGIKDDNRIENLRDCTRAENLQNQKFQHVNNSSGMLGVYQQGIRFRAQIRKDGKKICIGYFKTKEEAHLAYLNAKRLIHSTCTI